MGNHYLFQDSASEEDQDDIAIDDTLPYNPTHLNGNLIMYFL